jgi:hypothetical protein
MKIDPAEGLRRQLCRQWLIRPRPQAAGASCSTKLYDERIDDRRRSNCHRCEDVGLCQSGTAGIHKGSITLSEAAAISVVFRYQRRGRASASCLTHRDAEVAQSG